MTRSCGDPSSGPRHNSRLTETFGERVARSKQREFLPATGIFVDMDGADMNRGKLVRVAAFLPLAFALAATGARAAGGLNGKDDPKRGGPRSTTTETTSPSSPSAVTAAVTTTTSPTTTVATTTVATTTATATRATTTTATTTTATTSGTLLTNVDYSSPSPFGWTWQIQAGNDGFSDSYHAGSIFEAVTDPNGGTRRVAHVYLPARASGGRAAEGTASRHVDLGTTDFYGLSVRVPVGWHTIPQNASWHTVAAQFNYGSLGGPPVSLIVQPNDLEVMILAGKVTSSGGSVTGYEFIAAPNAGIPLYILKNLAAYEGQWIDLVFEIKWADAWNGYVNAWVRTPGGSWAQSVNTLQTFGKLVPTQQWGPGEDVQTDVNGIVTGTGGSWPSLNVPGQPMFTTDKAGLYAGPGSVPMDFWESTFVRGTTFAAVAERLS